MKFLIAFGYVMAQFLHPCGHEINTLSSSSDLNTVQLIEKATYLSQEEKAMIWEINLVRAAPTAYIPIVEEVLEDIEADSIRLSAMISETIRKTVTEENGREVVTVDTTYNNYYNSRVTAIRELLIELERAEPMRELIPNERLFMAAKKHGEKQARFRYIDHMGSDGTWPLDRMRKEAGWIRDGNENIARGKGEPRDIVLQLLIDSGVPSRGHRKNILNPEWEYVSCHNVNSLDASNGVRWWLQEFAY